MTNIKETLDERGTVYGAFRHNASVAQQLKHIWREYFSKSNFRAPYDDTAVINESMEMILHNIAKISTGDPTHPDAWVNIISYAQLVLEHIRVRADKDIKDLSAGVLGKDVVKELLHNDAVELARASRAYDIHRGRQLGLKE